MKVLNPCAGSPIRFSAGTRQSSNETATVSEPRSPIFFSRFPTLNPGVAVSMMKAEIPWVPLPPSVRAVKVMYFATLPLVMKIFEPLIRQPSATCSARVCVPAASEPAFGSVSPKAPIASPFAIGTRKRCFCSSVPFWNTGPQPSDTWAASVMAVEPQARAISSTAIEYASVSRPAPPYCSG